MLTTLYRHAMWDTPWRVNPSRVRGRYNAPGDLVQYWSDHPMGPAAEAIRAEGLTDSGTLLDLRLRMWCARVQLDGLIVIGFDEARSHSIEPHQLVGEDYEPTQALARRLRSQGAPGFVVPSAALPGTRVIVSFGAKVLFPLLLDPVDPEQVPTAHITDSPPPAEVLPRVRQRGTPHEGLASWRHAGQSPVFVEPAVPAPIRG